MRRALALVAVAALVSAAPVGALAKPKAKPKPRLPRCLTFTDSTGDAALTNPATAPATGEPGLDLTKVQLSATADNLVVKFTVAALADNVTKAWGDQFQISFTYDNKPVRAYYQRSRTRDAEANVFYQSGIYVNNQHVADSNAHVSAVYNVAAKTVTMSIKLRGLRSAAGRGIETGVLEAISAQANGSFVGVAQRWDSAEPADVFTEFKVGPCTP